MSEQAAHTPGPWVYDHTTLQIVRGFVTPEDADAWRIHTQAEQEVIAYVPDDGAPVTEANARLLAGAPAMYEALTQYAHVQHIADLLAKINGRVPESGGSRD